MKASKTSGQSQVQGGQRKNSLVGMHYEFMSMPVMSSIGISDSNMLTTKIREVTEMSPQLL